MLSETDARSILESAHSEWNRRNIEGVLARYTDDLTFWCNAGDTNGGPVSIIGKDALRDALASMLEATNCKSHILSFSFNGEIARSTAHHRVQHLTSGFVLTGKFRQVVRYRGKQICRLEEYHDAGRFTAFWNVVAQGNNSDSALVWKVT